MYALGHSSMGKPIQDASHAGGLVPPSSCIPRAAPHATKSPINHYKDTFQSSGHESDNTPTPMITGSHDATMPRCQLLLEVSL